MAACSFMESKVIARYSTGSLKFLLAVLLLADYFFADVGFLHFIQPSPLIQISLFWFWTIFIVLLASSLITIRQIISPTNILSADSSGVELRHRFFTSRLRIAWTNIASIRKDEFVFTSPLSGSQRPYRSAIVVTRPALELVFDDSIDLGVFGEAMAHPENRHVIIIADFLFLNGLNNAVEKLSLFKQRALGIKS
jgi:hypothetical protein